MIRVLLAIVVLLLAAANSTAAAAENQFWVYVGTYTQGKGHEVGKGIYAFHFDSQTGDCADVRVAAELPNPSYLTLDPKRARLFAVAETGSFLGKPEGGVCGFAMNARDGKLTLINQQNSAGRDPCHLSVDKTGRVLLVANYSSGTVACLAIDDQGNLAPANSIDKHDGSGPIKSRQDGPHAHWIDVDPSNRFALSADLGNDRVYVYQLDAAAASLKPCDPPYSTLKAGSGPRHLAFGKTDPKNVYVLNELSATATSMKFDDQTGKLTEFHTISTLPPDFHGRNTAAELQVHPSGKYLYTSNRGADNIAVFGIDPQEGGLRLRRHVASGGRTPRGFSVDPTGRWLLVGNQESDSIVVFSIDGKGVPNPTGKTIHVPRPVSILFAGAE